MSSIKLKEQLDDNFIVEFKENVKTFRDTEVQRRLDFIARKKSGKPFGSAWKTFGYKGPKYHDGFLYGLVDEKLHMTGDHIAYIYSDFTTVLLGKFSNGTMIAARPTKIVAEKCKWHQTAQVCQAKKGCTNLEISEAKLFEARGSTQCVRSI